jgi:methylthioxylose transferase
VSVSDLRLRLPDSQPAFLSGLPWAACAGALIVAGVGLGLTAAGQSLGTPLAPLLRSWHPRADPLAWVSVLSIAGALVVAPAILQRWHSPAAVAGALYLLAAGLGLAINLAHAGTRGWWGMFATGAHGSFEGRFEYLPGLPLLRDGTGHYLAQFPALLTYATTHIKGNPPGPLIALHLLGVHDAPQLAALCVGVGALSAPLTYDLGRTLGGEQRGRMAGILAAFSPAVLLFGVNSVDYMFAALGTAAACCLARPGWRWLALGAAAAAVATFFSWLLFAIPVWAALASRRRAPVLLGACALAICALNGLLALGYGYDPLAALRATHSFYVHGAAAARPYAFWLFGSPAAWILMLGLPIAWFAVRAAVQGDRPALALCGLIAAAALIGVTKAETERIWLPFVPLVCVGAAAAMPARWLRPVLTFLAVQALAVELLFFTVW